MKQRVLHFDGESLTRLSVEAPGPIRWIVRTRDQGDLLVGDRGGVLRYEGKKFRRLHASTSQNLRCVAVSPKDGTGYACGNSGTIVKISGDTTSVPDLKLRENLRRIAWDSTGEELLVVGNAGSADIIGAHGGASRVFGADTHLRSIAWHPSRKTALVTGNCFRDGIGSLTPSPNLFELEGHTLREVSTLGESSADLTASSWRPDGSSCLLAGFDQTWHTPALFTYSGGRMHVIDWTEPVLFPDSLRVEPRREVRAGGYKSDDPGRGRRLSLSLLHGTGREARRTERLRRFLHRLGRRRDGAHRLLQDQQGIHVLSDGAQEFFEKKSFTPSIAFSMFSSEPAKHILMCFSPDGPKAVPGSTATLRSLSRASDSSRDFILVL